MMQKDINRNKHINVYLKTCGKNHMIDIEFWTIIEQTK